MEFQAVYGNTLQTWDGVTRLRKEIGGGRFRENMAGGWVGEEGSGDSGEREAQTSACGKAGVCIEGGR